jgi:hypothetical protein
MGKASTALSKRLHVHVSGGVQGVFFRSYTKVSSMHHHFSHQWTSVKQTHCQAEQMHNTTTCAAARKVLPMCHMHVQHLMAAAAAARGT